MNEFQKRIHDLKMVQNNLKILAQMMTTGLSFPKEDLEKIVQQLEKGQSILEFEIQTLVKQVTKN